MSGLINSAQSRQTPPNTDDAPDDAPPTGDDLLAQVEQKVESQLTPPVRANYQKIVVAGMKAGLANGPNGIMGSLRRSQDPISDCARGAVAMVLVLRKEAMGVMPVNAMVPAAMTLMLKALAFAQRMGLVQVGQPELVRATHIFADAIFKAFHITNQVFAHYAGRVNQIINDPAQMELVNRKAGFVRHPDASTPTPLPGA